MKTEETSISPVLKNRRQHRANLSLVNQASLRTEGSLIGSKTKELPSSNFSHLESQILSTKKQGVVFGLEQSSDVRTLLLEKMENRFSYRRVTPGVWVRVRKKDDDSCTDSESESPRRGRVAQKIDGGNTGRNSLDWRVAKFLARNGLRSN